MYKYFKFSTVEPRKISGAKLKGTVATVASLCIVFTIFFASLFAGGCKEKEDFSKTDDASFLENLDNAPVGLVSFETIPEWLQDEIKTFKAESGSFNYFVAYKGVWESKSIYYVNTSFHNCFCDFRYENGVEIEMSIREKVYATSKNWVLIYQLGDMQHQKSSSVSDGRKKIEDKYEFSIKPGTSAWNRIESISERIKALQIPDAVLHSISTEGLLETCLEFPYLVDIFFYENYQKGFDELMDEFNGFRELFKRTELANVLIDRYFWMSEDIATAKTLDNVGKGKFSFRHFVLEFMLAQDEVLKNMNEELEDTLFLLVLEQKKLKNNNPDIFSSLNELPTTLLYAKKAVSENRVDPGTLTTLLNFIQAPLSIDINTVNYLNNHFNSK
jgi:hypothetical protein